MNKQLVKLSKFLSLVLRHRPEAIGINLDSGGWVPVDELMVAVNRARSMHLNKTLLQEIVGQNDKRRFTLSNDGLRIRANQGHSVSVDLGLEALQPPQYLFHGTATRFLPSIRRQGINRRKRHHVHLSADRQTAIRVGQRHGDPVVLTVNASMMYERGFLFYRSANGVWLTEGVGVEYIIFP